MAVAPVADADLRMTSPGITLQQVKDELWAWVKTLLSAAVYATLIVILGPGSLHFAIAAFTIFRAWPAEMV